MNRLPINMFLLIWQNCFLVLAFYSDKNEQQTQLIISYISSHGLKLVYYIVH
jgi:uncharacterized protein (DUF486 family)